MTPVLYSVGSLLGVQFWINVGLLAAIFGIFTAGLQLNVGLTGLNNFAQGAFMAIGAYATGILTTKGGLSFWIAIPLAMGITVVFALVMGLPTLRLRGDYFAIATIAFAEATRFTIQNLGITGGQYGLLGYDTAWQSVASNMLSALGLGTEYYLVPLLIVSWIIFLISLLILSLLKRTPWGRLLEAIREDQDAARSLGKPVLFYKMQSLAFASLLAAISGILLALDLAYLSPDEFLPVYTFIAFTMLIVGGLGSFLGVLVGAVLMETLLEGTSTVGLPFSASQVGALRFVIVGAVLLLLVVLRPQGLLGRREPRRSAA